MNKLVMDALAQGVAGLISSFFSTAARKGFAIILLVLAIVALGWLNFSSDAKHSREIASLKEESKDLREELKMCNADRAALAVKIAQLETRFELFAKSKR